MVDILNNKSCNIQPILSQLQPYNDNNLSLLVNRKLSIFKNNRLVYLIILHDDRVIHFIILSILYKSKINIINPNYQT